MFHDQNSEKPKGNGNQNRKHTLHSLERFIDAPVAGSVSPPDQTQLTSIHKISFEPECSLRSEVMRKFPQRVWYLSRNKE